MAFLDFLMKTKPNAPAVSIETLESKLSELREARAKSDAFLRGLDDRRSAMILADAPEAEILKLDVEADSARVQSEKCDAFEQELVARISQMRGDLAEQDWRGAYDAMHLAAIAHAKQMSAALASLYAYRHSAAGLSRFGRGMRWPEEAPIILGSEILESWLQNVERVHDFELSRRDRQARD
jgi:hypothetical protein